MTRFALILAAALGIAFPSAAQQRPPVFFFGAGSYASSVSPIFSGTVTFADGCTWGSTGVTCTQANTTFNWSPTGTGSFTVNPATAGTLNNVVIGGSTPLAVTCTTCTAGTSVTTPTVTTASGALALRTSAGPGLQVDATANAINSFQFVTAATGNNVRLNAISTSDANVGLLLASRGTGSTFLQTGVGVGAATQFEAVHTASATRWPTSTGSNGSTPAFSSTAGDLQVGAFTGNVRVGSGSVPTIASGACGTGSNGTVTAASRANAGNIAIGASATTVCTVVFATAMATAPVCVIAAANAAAAGATVLPYVSANTANGFVITGAVLASTSFNYICL